MLRNIILTLFVLLSFTSTMPAQSSTSETISLNLPASVISQAATAMLPLTIDAHSNTIKGDITITRISALQLTNGHLACRLYLAGSNLAFATEIAGHEIRLKVGSVKLSLKTNAAIRFDAKQQILFLKPLLQDISIGQNPGDVNISQALIAILNGREFPLRIQRIKPLIAKSGAKTITIDTRITDIKAKQGFIQFSLLPAISAK